MPPTKGGITTFMLNLMASYLNEQFEFVPYRTTRPPNVIVIVIDNWGYAAVLRGGLVRIVQGILLTIGRFISFRSFVMSRRIELVQCFLDASTNEKATLARRSFIAGWKLCAGWRWGLR
jgi:hypothetical protein